MKKAEIQLTTGRLRVAQLDMEALGGWSWILRRAIRADGVHVGVRRRGHGQRLAELPIDVVNG